MVGGALIVMTSYAPPNEGLICQRSSPMTISDLLGGITIFTVPPFQRDYAWDETAIDIFIGDVERCREMRLNSSPQPHFFGAIVTSPDTGVGTPRPHAILIDGQQRLATVFLFVCKLRERFHDAAEGADTDEFREAFKARRDDLKMNFEWGERSRISRTQGTAQTQPQSG